MRLSRLCPWLLAALLLPVLGALGYLAWRETRPSDEEVVVAQAEPVWRVQVTYRPAEPLVVLELQMDGLRGWPDAAYRVESAEPWVPRWRGRLEGRPSDSLVLRDGLPTPEPMTAQVARRVARSFTVVLQAAGREKVVDFGAAGFAEPIPLLERLRLPPFRSRLVGDPSVTPVRALPQAPASGPPPTATSTAGTAP